jgi:hypothetical protein
MVHQLPSGAAQGERATVGRGGDAEGEGRPFNHDFEQIPAVSQKRETRKKVRLSGDRQQAGPSDGRGTGRRQLGHEPRIHEARAHEDDNLSPLLQSRIGQGRKTGDEGVERRMATGALGEGERAATRQDLGATVRGLWEPEMRGNGLAPEEGGPRTVVAEDGGRTAGQRPGAALARRYMFCYLSHVLMLYCAMQGAWNLIC